jgi:hypothetical protein
VYSAPRGLATLRNSADAHVPKLSPPKMPPVVMPFPCTSPLQGFGPPRSLKMGQITEKSFSQKGREAEKTETCFYFAQ